MLFPQGSKEDDDPFSECDLRQEMESLIDKTMPADGRCTLKDYLEGDNELQVFVDKGVTIGKLISLNSLVMRTNSKMVMMKLMKMMRLKWMLNHLLQK